MKGKPKKRWREDKEEDVKENGVAKSESYDQGRGKMEDDC